VTLGVPAGHSCCNSCSATPDGQEASKARICQCFALSGMRVVPLGECTTACGFVPAINSKLASSWVRSSTQPPAVLRASTSPTPGIQFCPSLMDRGKLTREPTLYPRSEEHTSELQSRENLVCRLLLEKKKTKM